METLTPRRRVLILGAAGRDFHNFNTVYRGDPRFELIASRRPELKDCLIGPNAAYVAQHLLVLRPPQD